MARSVHDLLLDASAATTVERALEILDAAFAVAEPNDIQAIAETAKRISVLPDVELAAVLDRALARALDARAYYGIYEVAHARANRLGDPVGANAALAACNDRMLDDPDEPRSYTWVRLADEFARVSDPASALRVLTHGRDRDRAAPGGRSARRRTETRVDARERVARRRRSGRRESRTR